MSTSQRFALDLALADRPLGIDLARSPRRRGNDRYPDGAGAVKLSQLSAPMMREFEDRLARGDMPAQYLATNENDAGTKQGEDRLQLLVILTELRR